MHVEFLESKPTAREMMLYNSSSGQIKEEAHPYLPDRDGRLATEAIVFQMALTLWAGTGTALKSTAQARPGPACFVPVPGTARQQCRAWAATSAR